MTCSPVEFETGLRWLAERWTGLPKPTLLGSGVIEFQWTGADAPPRAAGAGDEEVPSFEEAGDAAAAAANTDAHQLEFRVIVCRHELYCVPYAAVQVFRVAGGARTLLGVQQTAAVFANGGAHDDDDEPPRIGDFAVTQEVHPVTSTAAVVLHACDTRARLAALLGLAFEPTEGQRAAQPPPLPAGWEAAPAEEEEAGGRLREQTARAPAEVEAPEASPSRLIAAWASLVLPALGLSPPTALFEEFTRDTEANVGIVGSAGGDA